MRSVSILSFLLSLSLSSSISSPPSIEATASSSLRGIPIRSRSPPISSTISQSRSPPGSSSSSSSSTSHSSHSSHSSHHSNHSSHIFIPIIPYTQRAVFNLHVSHSDGINFCSIAKLNNEKMNHRLNCNLDSDIHRYPSYRTCETRYKELKLTDYTFLASERGLLQDEFCPNIFRYLFYFRHPLDVIDSTFPSIGNSTQLFALGESNHWVIQFLELFPKRSSHPQLRMPLIPPLYRSDNYFTRFLSFNASVYFAPWGKITEEHFLQASRNLKLLDFVFTDHDLSTNFEKVMQTLSRHLKWTTDSMEEYKALAESAHKPYHFTPELMSLLTKVNQFDLKLYEEAQMKD
jgi:hypothetical protein